MPKKADATIWMPAFRHFITMVKVPSKETAEPQPIKLYRAQNMLLESICDALDEGIHHIVALKARQLGASTVLQLLDLFWLYMHPGLQGAFIADSGENKETFRDTFAQMLDSLPRAYKVPVSKHNRSTLIFNNNSRLQYMSAGHAKNSGLGRSRALNFVHACVAPGTPVIVEDGHVKPVEEVKIGDVVLTHTGAKTEIIDAVGQPNTKGDLIRITPWLGQSLSFTSEHTIPTQRGILEAKDVEKTDWLIMPIRKITTEQTAITLPETRAGKRLAVGSGATVKLDREFGFVCGYYLAEGCIQKQTRDDRPAGIFFARHRDEVAYGQRAIAVMSKISTHSRTFDRPGTQTSIEYFYGVPVATWMSDTFGGAWKKKIPDIVFTWGEEFCAGLMQGLLCGDGSKKAQYAKSPDRAHKYIDHITKNGKRFGRPRTGSTDPSRKYELNQVVLPTIHSSIAMQARDLAASLGMGWGGVAFRAAHVESGRNCKGQWRVTWNGSAAAALREAMGLPTIARSGRSWIEKYKVKDGLVYLKIRLIENGIKCNTIYDLSVPHEDHTFRTPFMAVGNTECSSYGDQKGLDSLQRALAEENPNRLYVFESTALGFNVFYDMYQEAKRNPAQKAVFIGWWAKDTYILREGSPEFDYWWGRYPRMTDEEQERAGLVAEKYGWDLTPEQVAWYRKQSLDKSEESLFEELPSTEEEAFQATGSPFFSRKRVTEDQNFIRNNQVMFKGYAYQLGTKFTSTVITPTNRMEDLDLRVWEEPKPNGKYVIGMDPTYGRSEEADRCVISVWRCYSDKMVQAAEFCNDATEPQQGAWVLAHLAGSYRDCVVNLEINGPGMSVMDELKYVKEQISFGQLREPAAGLGITTALDNMRWYFYHRPDSMGAGFAYNWRTSFDNKLRLLNNFRDAYNTNIVIARSIPLLEEFTTLVQDGQTIQASGRNKDDRIFAAALAQMAWAEWIRTGMMANQQSYDRVTAAERDTTVRGDSVVSNIVSGFFKEKAEERAAAARAALERY